MKTFRQLIAVALLVSTSAFAKSTVVGRMWAGLSGFSEVPPNFTTGRAELRMWLTDDGTIQFRLRYAGLSGNPAAAHIHFGQPRVNGGVSVFCCGGGEQPACPESTSGLVEGTITADKIVGPAAQGINPGELRKLLIAMRLGETYANMHTPMFPNGEIRGLVHFARGDGSGDGLNEEMDGLVAPDGEQPENAQ